MFTSAYLIWFFFGVGFLVSEFIVPGFILIFFTAGCWFVAGIIYFFPDISYSIQLTIFTISSLILLFSLRRLLLSVFRGVKKKGVVVENSSKVGTIGVVTVAIPNNGFGEVGLDGTFWRALADMPIERGQMVKVIAHDPKNNLILKVDPAS